MKRAPPHAALRNTEVPFLERYLWLSLLQSRADLEFDLEDPHVEAGVAAVVVVGPADILNNERLHPSTKAAWIPLRLIQD